MTMVDTHSARADGLPSYAMFAGVLAAAGLPIYIHAPKFYADTFGVSLTALGGALAIAAPVGFGNNCCIKT